jgi:hypothetical protein
MLDGDEQVAVARVVSTLYPGDAPFPSPEVLFSTAAA